MKRGQRTIAEQGVRLLEDALRKDPPKGVSAQAVAAFFQQHREELVSALTAQLAQMPAAAAPPSAVDETPVACGCRHADAAPSLPPVRRRSPRERATSTERAQKP